MTVDPERKASFPLYFRIPAWCASRGIAINGAAADAGARREGLCRIERPWAKGNRVVLTFPMSVHVARGMETEYPAAVRTRIGPMIHAEWFQKRRFPYASVSYGPLLFALAIPDKDPGTPLPARDGGMPWTMRRSGGGPISRSSARAMPAHWDWPLAAPLALQVPARTVDWNPTEVQALPAAPLKGAGRDHSPDPLRLHEVPHLDVSRHAPGLGPGRVMWQRLPAGIRSAHRKGVGKLIFSHHRSRVEPENSSDPFSWRPLCVR